MTLAAQLDKLRTDLAEKIPADAQTVMHAQTQQLRDSAIMNGVIKVGERLPDFALANAAGNIIESKDLLARGAVVLTVFRGSW